MVNRRDMIFGLSGAIALSGCTAVNLEDSEIDSTEGASSSQPEEDNPSESSTQTTDSSESQTEEESCETEQKDKTDVIRDREYSFSDQSEPGPYVSAVNEIEFDIEKGDLINIEISTSNQQSVDVEFSLLGGGTVFSDQSQTISEKIRLNERGDGIVKITSAAETTQEVKSEIWSGSKTVDAGRYRYGWVTLREGNSVEYFIRQLGDGARPKLYIEDKEGAVLLEEPVSDAIDGKFTAPETGEYYFKWENTAMLTSGNWRWEFTRVSDLVEGTDVDVLIEREYTEDVEVCDN